MKRHVALKSMIELALLKVNRIKAVGPDAILISDANNRRLFWA